jgi:hypothetical protein
LDGRKQQGQQHTDDGQDNQEFDQRHGPSYLHRRPSRSRPRPARDLCRHNRSHDRSPRSR